MTEPDEASATGYVGRSIARMLERAGLQPRQQINYVAQALDLGYQLARRRMIGETPWTVDELARLATSCGETLTSLFADEEEAQASDPGLAAELVLGAVRVPCQIWLGSRTGSRPASQLVAREAVRGQWVVTLATEGHDGTAHAVERLVFQSATAKRHRVAVLDDDRDLADSIADYMNHTGLDASAYYSVAELTKQQKRESFDGYVVDWLIERETARPLIASIRLTSPACPIVLLTGQLETGKADESELASIATSYRLTYFEKPIRTSSLLSALQMGFESPAG
jgi:ActR/RegA family two-component response regulator